MSILVTLKNENDNGAGRVILDTTDADEAVACLDGALLDVGRISSGGNTFPPEPGAATLRIELVTSRPGAGLSLDFLVGSAPPAP